MTQTVPSLIINEVMVNPNNVASLPPFEYIELLNNSSETIELSSINLHINNNQQSLPKYKLAPNQYVIVCSPESVSDFLRYGNAVELTRWYALNNAGSTIQLTHNGVILDEISYRDTWYNNSSKRNGGWSLERINPNWNCNINLNWSATNSLSGGTPGKPNSIWDKNYIPTLNITNYKVTQNKVSLTYNLVNSYFSNISETKFIIDEGIGESILAEVIGEYIVLTFARNLTPQKLYTLKIEGLKICNLLLPTAKFELFEQQNVQPDDIIINEILFNPREGGVDFVEIYNTTEFPINLQKFRLGTRDISTQLYLLQPHHYLAVTTNKNIILQHYPNAIAENILEIPILPSYTNQQGIVTLYSNQSILLDSIYYSAAMHAGHLIDPKGISLERTSIKNSSLHSASTLYGGATPGYRNSTLELDIPKNKINLTTQTFSPNDDGYEDELEINYELINPNYIINVEIYNDKGQLVKKLAHQNLAGTHGSILWDGKNESGQRCAKGHYICSTQIFNHEGKTQKFKQPFVLINSLTRH